MRRLVLFQLLLLLAWTHSFAQATIQMVEDAGVYKVPCEINGLKVKMIFDTGAATVSIPSSLAEMMLDNGYLSREDFRGKSNAITADGRIVENTKIILKTLNVGGVVLFNVDAVVVKNNRALILLGQSAIQKLGKVSVKGDKLYIEKGKISDSSNGLYERWDAKLYSYSNYTYGFGWKLPAEFEWVREQGEEQHTPFRATGGPFLVFVNAQVADNNADLWASFTKIRTAHEKADEELEKKTGKMVYERTWEKNTLFGQHALKTTFKEYFKDSRFDDAVETYAEEYYLIRNGHILIIAIKVNKDIYDQFDCASYFRNIIQGFTITTTR